MDVVVTPEVAESWLATWPAHADADKVERYAALMAAGLWRPGPVMRFEGSEMRDGAHRCTAVIRSGATITVTILGAGSTAGHGRPCARSAGIIPAFAGSTAAPPAP